MVSIRLRTSRFTLTNVPIYTKAVQQPIEFYRIRIQTICQNKTQYWFGYFIYCLVVYPILKIGRNMCKTYAIFNSIQWILYETSARYINLRHIQPKAILNLNQDYISVYRLSMHIVYATEFENSQYSMLEGLHRKYPQH